MLVFIGTLATLASLTLFVPDRMMDSATALIMPWIAAILWAVLGLSSFNVMVGAKSLVEPITRPILPVAYLGIGFAMIAALFGMYRLIKAPATEVEDADITLGGRQ